MCSRSLSVSIELAVQPQVCWVLSNSWEEEKMTSTQKNAVWSVLPPLESSMGKITSLNPLFSRGSVFAFSHLNGHSRRLRLTVPPLLFSWGGFEQRCHVKSFRPFLWSFFSFCTEIFEKQKQLQLSVVVLSYLHTYTHILFTHSWSYDCLQ